jgi:hypothetical protein
VLWCAARGEPAVTLSVCAADLVTVRLGSIDERARCFANLQIALATDKRVSRPASRRAP